MSAKLLGAAFEAKMGSHTRKLILLKLCDAGHDDGTKIFPAVDTIAGAAECSRREVQRQLRQFEDSTLLACVAYENGGRGKAREYIMHLEVLREMALVGFAEVLDREVAKRQEKGDTTSPFSDGRENGIPDQPVAGDDPQKGDMASPFNSGERATYTTERATPTTERATPGVAPPLKPLRPLTPAEGEREASAEEPKNDPVERDDARFVELMRKHPGIQDPGIAFGAFERLTDAERTIALERHDGYLAIQRAEGRKHHHALATYLGKKLFDQVPDPNAEAARTRVTVEPRTKQWWGLFWRRFKRGDRVGFMLSQAADNHAWSAPLADLPSEAELATLVSIEKGSPEWEAWNASVRPRGLNLDGDSGKFIFVPSEWPEPAT